MTRTMLSVLGGVLLALATLPACPSGPAAPEAASASDRAAAEQRFAVRFCFNQYRSQQDATQCLARYVR
jgi:hypothetical protein